MLYGTNKSTWSDMSDAGLQGLATYREFHSDLPASWESSAPRSAISIMSIKPNIPDLLAGKLDARVLSFIADAPPHSMLTAYHEGNRYLGAPTYRDVQAHMTSLCHHTQVRYGSILSATYALKHGQSLVDYLPHKMRWVGLDGYQASPDITIEDLFLKPTLDIQDKWTTHFGITETNSQVDVEPWLTETFQFAMREGLDFYAPFFNAYDGGYPWDPKYAETIAPHIRRVNSLNW